MVRNLRPAARGLRPGRAARWRGALGVLAAGALFALTAARPAAAALPADAPTSHADAPGIDWFVGDVNSAFAAAQREGKPVFLYWGAKWCPPCQQLKSSVFSRADFIAKSKAFIAVYLDGDEPGAQAWGEKFKVGGYPTVVLLRADGGEIMRIAGGMDLSRYADLLDVALSDSRPIGQVLEALRGGATPSRADCQRLAFHAWDLTDFPPAQRAELAELLLRAAAGCAPASTAERARIAVAAAGLQPSAAAVSAVIGIVADAGLASRVADALVSLGKPFFAAVRARGPEVRASFLQGWLRVMGRVAEDPRVIDADQLEAIGAQLRAWRELTEEGRVPPAAAAAARARVAATLARPFEPYVRSGIVNAAAFIDDQLGDLDAEYAMLHAELATARAPYYYMADLGDVEERRGHAAAALQWYQRAYRDSRGAATRFQWGSRYLAALLRLTPGDDARIRAVGLQLLGELDGPERIQARTRANLAKLDGQLRAWNADHRHEADIRALRARMATVCGRLPATDTGRASCRQFLG